MAALHLMRTEIYYPVLRDAELLEGRSKAVEIRGKQLMIIRLKGLLRAVENSCSHMGVPFEEGPLADGHLVCPWHAARFCATSGDHLEGPGFCGLEQFPVRVSAVGNIEVGLKHGDVTPHPLRGKRATAGILAAEETTVEAEAS
ncbi:MAG: Rieske 2Fe-2S domain-containing protein [Acidobacteria bacterium]|nr:Rieske 2Fe-2S domain-containing protein [Acidobacteriota bacterium]